MRLLEACYLFAGTVATAGLLAAAADPWLRRRAAPVPVGAAVVRTGVLMAVAAFVWLRPGVKPAGVPSVLYLGMLAALVTLVLWSARPGPFRGWLAGVLHRADRPSAVGLAVITAVLAASAVALPIAAHWDVSGWMDSQSYDTFAINIVTGKAPAGSSGYMPVYQYGLAAVYYLFGHWFFAQQLVNALLACAGAASFCLAAWWLFQGSGAAAAMAGLLYVFSPQLFYGVHFTQIEAWYVPIVSAVLLAWARYWRQPSARAAVWLGVAIGLGLNTRNQGALFLAWMCAAPLVVAGLAVRERMRHAGLVGLVVAVSLVPWTVRNYAVDGRWSPFADRGAMYLAILSDPRIGLYGVRYWEGWDEVAAEYQSRHVDVAERERAYLAGTVRNLVRDPAWMARALAWRSAAFYGVLPDGMLALDGIVPTHWRDEWRRYLFSRTTPLLLLPLSLVGAIWRRDRTSAFLVGGVAASLAITIASASPEDRISYPVLPLHILLVAGVFALPAAATAETAVPGRPRQRRGRVLVMIAIVVAAALAGSRAVWGSRFEYRPLMERAVTVNAGVVVDGSRPSINDVYASRPTENGPLRHATRPGERVRLRGMITNYMYPPKFVGPVPFVPAFATDPSTPTYYYGYLLTGGPLPLLGPAVGLTYRGAEISEPLREGDAVEIEGIVEHASPDTVTGYWLRVEKARRLPIDRADLPVFP